MSTKLTLTAVALAGAAFAAAPGVRPVSQSRTTRSLTAVGTTGPTYLAAREVQVDLDFPDGSSGKGILYVLFEPASGLYFHTLGWKRDANLDFAVIDHVEAYSRVGILPDCLFIVTFAMGIVIQDSAERAGSLDDAEAQALKWYADRLPQVEDRSYRNPTTNTDFPVVRSDFPKGFFREGLDARLAPPVKLVDMVRKDDGTWLLTLESTEDPSAHHRAAVILRRGGIRPIRDAWSMSGIFAAEPEKPK
jgi:hypothetical protein